ncbi:TPA: cupin domain-containing protein [Streptococcus equi subsp. zooepidemicus]|nr:cupin domain-containing protein [Streptococcus equi subsp. zooepidemicus]HEL0197513.1 cupin domain-containing protein [Streptococcus equi subsp. zooepidemicus]HEL0207483.1 cupin domain-containing protein [Streptococcus equi subsp. zooepidemicus]HEL0533153.1 cupin domain-containing protein [Streptococcus equi subsp. zooepidemicus]HEL0569355.1 cupin domain-containing protein [Streptococcus equi subsp. zooepidemicus]
MSLIRKIPTSAVIDLKAEVPIEEDQILSRTLVQRKDLGITLLSLDKGQEIGRHSSPGDAMVNVLSGVADITIGEACYEVAAGETIIMPADIPHSLFAKEAFQMLLVVVKPEA